VGSVVVEHVAVGLDDDLAVEDDGRCPVDRAPLGFLLGDDSVAAAGLVGVCPLKLAPLARVGFVGRDEQEAVGVGAGRVPERGDVRDEPPEAGPGFTA
jgi:hypothetical protein